MDNYLREKEELLSNVDKLIIGRTRLEQALRTYRGGKKYRDGYSKAELKVILDLIPKIWGLGVKYEINDTKISSDITRKVKNTGSNNAGRQTNTTHRSLPDEDAETKIPEDKLLSKYINPNNVHALKDKIERQKMEKKRISEENEKIEEAIRSESARKLEEARILEEKIKLEQLKELQERIRLEETKKREDAKILEENVRKEANRTAQEKVRLEEVKKLEDAIKLEQKMMEENPEKLKEIALENARKLEDIFKCSAKMKLKLTIIPESNDDIFDLPPAYDAINSVSLNKSTIKVEDQLEQAFHQMFPQKYRFDKYYTLFQSQDIDWSIFTDIDDKILVDIGITLLGPRYKIMKKIYNIKNNIKDVSFYPDTELRSAFHQIFPDPGNFNTYYNLFRDQEVDYDIFLDMTDKDLVDIGITLLGPRIKIKKKISQLRGDK